MFGLSLGHLILFGVIALIFVGPEQLPEVARTIGRVLNELRRATSDFQSHFTGQVNNFNQHNWQEPSPPPAPQMTSAPAVEPTAAETSAPAQTDEEKKS